MTMPPTNIAVAATPGAATKGVAASAVHVDQLPQTTSAALGLDGVVYNVRRSNATSSGLDVQIDYRSFATAGGADFGSRLHLVALPPCALTSPSTPRCRVVVPITSTNDSRHGRLIARIAGVRSGPGRTVPQLGDAARSQLVFAAIAAVAGSGGDYSATSLAPAGSWSTSGGSGNFDWSYPLSVPPPASGADVAPSVAIGYDSGSVDGRIATTNNQSSQLGEGWSYDPGFVERTYRSCGTDKTLPAASQTSDECWAGQIVTMSVNGHSASLVQDDNDHTKWRSSSDDGSRIQLIGAGPAGYQGEYWLMTTTDGTKYFFGRNILPGGDAAHATNSAWTEPVFGPHAATASKPADPCYSSASFAQSVCAQAWRWNLDMVEDVHGNATAYYYTPEVGYYGENKGTTTVAYTRGGYLDHIDYGLLDRSSSIYASTAPERVTFTSQERCLATTAVGTITCTSAGSGNDNFTPANASHWPDTPVDQNCPATGTCANWAPSFWSRRMLSAITTSYSTGTNDANGSPVFTPVDTYALTHNFQTDADGSLALTSIQRTAAPASANKITTPAVTFTPKLLDNRVHDTNGQSDMLEPRLAQITTDTGSVISVTYDQAGRSPAQCTNSTLPADPATNTAECFPVKWTPLGHSAPILDYFHKHVVTEVDTQDTLALGPTHMTTYKYVGGAAWHQDDNEIVKADQRTWGQFRGYQTVETRDGNVGNNSYGDSGGGPADSLTLTTTTYYRGMGASLTDSRGDPATVDANQFAGRGFETRTFNGDTADEVSTSITDFKIWATNATRDRSGTGLSPLTADVVEPVTTYAYTDVAGGSDDLVQTDTAWDSSARATRQSEAVTGVATTCTLTSYADNTTTWVRIAPSRVTVAEQACASDNSITGTVLADTKTYYDAKAFGSATLGDSTETDTLVTSSPAHWARNTAAYDTRGRVTAKTTFLGDDDTVGRTTTTAYTANSAGQLSQVKVTDAPAAAEAQITTGTYERSRQLQTASVDPSGLRTDVAYDPLGRITSVWQPGQSKSAGDKASTTFAYLVRTDGPLAVTTNKLIDPGVDANGNQKPTSYATTVALFDQSGELRQTQSEAPDGSGDRVVRDTFADSHGWVVRTNERWATNGAPSTSIISTADSGIRSRNLTIFDGAGRPVTTDEYDGLTKKRTTSTVYSGDRTTTIPPSGGVETTSVLDGRGKTTELDRWTTPPTITSGVLSGGAADVTRYTYTTLGLQSTMTSAAQSTTLASTSSTSYDLLGRPVSSTNPDSGTISTVYDDAGDITSTTEPATVGHTRTLAFTYDGLGRRSAEYQTSVTPSNELSSWTYDSLMRGKLTSTTRYTPGGQYATSVTGYTTAGDPTGQTVSLPASETGFGSSYTSSETWTSTHQLETETPADGGGLPADETITHYYDAYGQAYATEGFGAYASQSSWDAYGEPTQYSLGADPYTTTVTFDRDAQTRQLTSVDTSTISATPLVDHTNYTYDPAGNTTQITDNEASAGTENQCFTYDALDRITQAWAASTSCTAAPTTSRVGGSQPYWLTWTYDAAGGRRTQTQHALTGGTDTKTTYNNGVTGHAHALDGTADTGGSTRTTSYTYNADGSAATTAVNGSATVTFGYDAEGHTQSVSTGSPADSASYIYNTDGTLLVRRQGTKTTLYLPGEELTRDSSTAKIVGTRHYTHNGTEVAVRVGFASLSYEVGDPNHTMQIAIPLNGTTLGAPIRRFYDPFGNLLSAPSGAWPDNRGFLNQPTSDSTGLVDLGQREYDPTTGRFESVDALANSTDPAQSNGYSYGWQNPLAHADPTGLEPRNAGECFADDDACNRKPPAGLKQAPRGGDQGVGYSWDGKPAANVPKAKCHSDSSCGSYMKQHPPLANPNYPKYTGPTTEAGVAQWLGLACDNNDICMHKDGVNLCTLLMGDAGICQNMNQDDLNNTIARYAFRPDPKPFTSEDLSLLLSGISAATGLVAMLAPPLAPVLEPISVVAGAGSTAIDCYHAVDAQCGIGIAATVLGLGGASSTLKGVRAARLAEDAVEAANRGAAVFNPEILNGTRFAEMAATHQEGYELSDYVLSSWGLSAGAVAFANSASKMWGEGGK